MKPICNKKVVRTMSLIVCCAMLLIIPVQIVYAMGLTEEEKAEMQDEIAMVEPYEMNIVLLLLDVKGWTWPPYSLDDAKGMERVGEQPDEPLGKYSEELLKEYVEGNVKVEIDYFYDFACSTNWLVQVIQIYIDGKQEYFTYHVWAPGAIDGQWAVCDASWTDRIPDGVIYTFEEENTDEN